MNTKRKLRKAIRQIISEDAESFEKMIKYAADSGTVKADAKEFAKTNAGSEEEAKEWIEQFDVAYEDELGPYAEVMDATFEDLEKYGSSSDSGTKEKTEAQDKIEKAMAKMVDLKEYIQLYKAACEEFNVEPMSGEDFKKMLKEKGTEGMFEYLEDVWKDTNPNLPNLFQRLYDMDEFDPSDYGLKEGDDGEYIPDPDADDGDVKEEATVETAEEELDDIDTQLEDFNDTLEEFIEAAYKAKETDEYKSLVKDFQLMQKYTNFIVKLFDKIINFAKSKDRDDVVELTNHNFGVFAAYVDMQNQKGVEFKKQLAADDEGYDWEDPSGGNPSQKTIKGMAKAYKAQIEDFKKIVGSIKKNPLKKLDEENLLKESKRSLDRVLMEIKIQQYTRKRLNGQLRG